VHRHDRLTRPAPFSFPVEPLPLFVPGEDEFAHSWDFEKAPKPPKATPALPARRAAQARAAYRLKRRMVAKSTPSAVMAAPA
jgi:hypothetical protein